MRMFVGPLLFLAAAIASSAEIDTYDLTKLEHVDGPSFRPGNKAYPADLIATGVQGESAIVVPLTEDGWSNGATLGKSSGSAQLDQIALDLARTAKFQIKEAPAKGWKAVVVTVEFYKDSVTTVKQKTCADFNVDLAYFAKTFPEQKPADMRIFNMLTGMSYISLGSNPSQAGRTAKLSAAATQPTIAACNANPDKNLFDTWVSAFESAS